VRAMKEKKSIREGRRREGKGGGSRSGKSRKF